MRMQSFPFAFFFRSIFAGALSVLLSTNAHGDEQTTVRTDGASIRLARAELVRLGARLEFDRNARVELVAMAGFRETDKAMHFVAQLCHVRTLDLRESDITDRGLAELAKLKKLERLCLWATNVTDAGLQYLSEMRDLKELALGDTNIGNVAT